MRASFRLSPTIFRSMESFDFQNRMHIGAMNLLSWHAFASSRSMTVLHLMPPKGWLVGKIGSCQRHAH